MKKTTKFKMSAMIAMIAMAVLAMAGCSNDEQDKSTKTVDTAVGAKETVTYDIAYIDQESSNTSSTKNFYATDVIGYMNGDKEGQVRVALENGLPASIDNYKTQILTNPDEKPTVTISKIKGSTSVTVKRQPYQRYIQPNVAGTITNKEENK